QREVQSALALAETPKLTDYGKRLLQEIDEHTRGQGGAAASESSYTIQHQGPNAQGWQVTETSHFRIFHKQAKDYVEKVAYVTERTRRDMYRKWFGNSGPEWSPKCDVVLHANAQDYGRETRVNPASPGHSKIERDRCTGRVVQRLMHMHAHTGAML